MPDMDAGHLLTLGLTWYIAFLFSLTCHEAAHALTGLRFGDRTAENQVTLNPAPHMQREPIGTMLAPWLTFITGGWMIGWASAPYDPYWRMRHPRAGALVSLAGPAANFIIAILAAILIRVGLSTRIFLPPDAISMESLILGLGPWEGPAIFLSILFSLNILLGLFNLIPLPPLDGFGALALVLPSNLANKLEELRQQPMFSLLGMLIAWKTAGFIIGPFFWAAVQLLFS